MCWKCVVVSRLSYPLLLLLTLKLTGELKYEENWKELTKMLNNTLGPKKTVEEWKMVNFYAADYHSLLTEANCAITSWIMNVCFFLTLRFSLTGRISYALVRRNSSRFRTERPEAMTSWPSRSWPTWRSVRWSCGEKTSRIKTLHRWVLKHFVLYFASPHFCFQFDSHFAQKPETYFPLSILNFSYIAIFRWSGIQK